MNEVEMMRSSTIALLLLCLTGCNLKDDISFPGTDTGKNNTVADAGDDSGDATDPGALMVSLSNPMVNGDPLPTQVAAQSGPFTVAADVTASNSSGCEGCRVQVVVGYTDGPPPVCLYDDVPGSDAISASAELDAAETAGARDLVWVAYEEAGCDAALARAMSEMPDGTVLGAVEFTDASPLMVVSVAPDADANDVVVTSMIHVVFNANLDQSSVQGRVTLTDANGPVPATVSVMNNEIVLTPSSPLAEFQTQYNVVVTAGVTGEGRSLEQDFTSSFRTRMFVPDTFYAASDEFHGVGFSLGIDAANQCAMMPADDTAPAQRFRFVPRDGGWIAYNSLSIAVGRALDGGDGVMNCQMSPLNATPLPAQIWSFMPQMSGSFVIQNTRFGTAQSLDSTTSPPGVGGAKPLMQPTASVDHQSWRWRRLQ